MGLFSKFRAKKSDEGSVFTTGPILTPDQLAGIASSSDDAAAGASFETASLDAAVGEGASSPSVPAVPPLPAVPAGTSAKTIALPAIDAAPVAFDSPDAAAAEPAPRGKHARVADLPQVDSGAAAASATQTPAHAASAVADSSSDAPTAVLPNAAAPTAVLPNVQAADSSEPASFEDSFFAENGFDMAEDSKRGKHRGLKIAGISVAAALVVAYGAGVGVFSGHFYPNTTGAGIDLSLKNVEEASAALEANVVNYNLTINGKDMDLAISGDDIDFSLSGDNVAAKMLEQSNPWLWPYEVFQTHDTTDAYTTNFDEAKLASILDAAIAEHNESAVPSQDAKLGYIESTGKIGVVPESYGTELVAHEVVTKINEAVSKAQRTVTLDDKDVVAPTVLSTDQGLNKAAANAQKLSHADVKLTIDGEAVAEINARQYVEWLNIAEDYSVSIDEGKMNDWISNLCAGFNTIGSERTYTRPDGKVVTVSGGDYGWEIDSDSLRASILDAVANNTVGTIEVPVWQRAQVFAGAGEQDWGSRYVDVDLSEQYVRFYDGGEIIWESDCITGAGYDYERITPEGVYDVNDRANNVPLRPMENGRQVEEPTYVTYWMPFIGNMIGLHDAWWQPYFGGSAYMDGLGSHGCINLPTYAAEELFYIIEVGDVVITHY